jgi:hypothetical protein
MQCDNCGYIFFKPSKKCSCCSAPYALAPSAFEVGQENLFTVFEMAPGEGGIPSGMGMAGSEDVAGDYNFTDDFDTGDTEYGVDENVLDLSEAEAEGFGPSTGSMGVDSFEFDTSAMDDIPAVMENAGADNFDLNLSEDPTDIESVSTETVEPEVEVADAAGDKGFGGGFDSEVEGLGFGFDESPAEDATDDTTEEISLDDTLEPELELAEEEPSLELSEEPELDIDDGPSLELPEEPSLEYSEESDLDTDELYVSEDEPSLELLDDLELTDEPELMEAPTEEAGEFEVEDKGGIEFDLDSMDLDAPEEVSYEVPETEAGDEESSMDFDGLELEMDSPEEPEEDNLKQ